MCLQVYREWLESVAQEIHWSWGTAIDRLWLSRYSDLVISDIGGRVTKPHRYAVCVRWTGNNGIGTSSYRSYSRQHEISTQGKKMMIEGSSDPAFRGDPSRWNPEELLVASLSACHQLWYLHLCAEFGVVVVAYVDHAEGLMEESADGSGCFKRVVLRPVVTISRDSDATVARELHDAAQAKCFIFRSVNFPVEHEPEIRFAEADATLKQSPGSTY